MTTITIDSPIGIQHPNYTEDNSLFPISGCETILVTNNIKILARRPTPASSSTPSQPIEIIFTSTHVISLPPGLTVEATPTSSTNLAFT